LLEAAVTAGIVIPSICGGDGICGRCKMVIKQGNVKSDVSSLLSRDEIRAGMVLACQAYIQSDLVVEIPEETRAGDRLEIDRDAYRFRAFHPGIKTRKFEISPLVKRFFVELELPTLAGNVADSQRLQDYLSRITGTNSIQIGLKVLRRLPRVLRENNFAVTVTAGRRKDVLEIMDVEGGDLSRSNYFVVVDAGTTTIVCHLLDVVNIRTVDAEACFNSQAIYGRDVTSRIISAEKKGIERLQELLIEDINRLIAILAERNKVKLHDITAVVVAGNTVMTHFLLGLMPDNIRRKPYIAVDVEPPPFRAAEVGLKINPRGLLYVIPGIGSWVGGDITAGILATGIYESDEICMLMDIGTNGEIVVGNKEWMVACSASTGPALEGASVECGMMAETGAIEKVYWYDGRLAWKVIGNVEPRGICGSGIIDMVAVLLENGIIDRAGRFIPGSCSQLVEVDGQLRLKVSDKVFITQDDLQNIITAKAAIFAASRILLERVNLEWNDIARVYIAGGFGSYIDRANAVKIGLLPDLPLSVLQYVGNTSIQGATLAALSQEANEILRAIRRKTTYYDLMGYPDYVDQFRQAMFLPHTDISMFPSVNMR
jgi:uncharacterized 2Fe-2S/4Fe-4S cluster protein (DUF4445 family)